MVEPIAESLCCYGLFIQNYFAQGLAVFGIAVVLPGARSMPWYPGRRLASESVLEPLAVPQADFVARLRRLG